MSTHTIILYYDRFSEEFFLNTDGATRIFMAYHSGLDYFTIGKPHSHFDLLLLGILIKRCPDFLLGNY